MNMNKIRKGARHEAAARKAGGEALPLFEGAGGFKPFRYRGHEFKPLRLCADVWAESRKCAEGIYRGRWDSSKRRWTGGFSRDGGYSWDGFYDAAKRANGGKCEADVFDAGDAHVVPATVGLFVWND